MSNQLKDKKIAFIATDGVEEIELTDPWRALEDEGAKLELLSIKEGEIMAWKMKQWGQTFHVDKLVSQANVNDYDGLVLPGGVMNPDFLRANKDAVSFVKKFYESGKPIGAICHGPWTLIEADVVKGVTMTSWPSLKTDLKNAGAHWVDEQVVTDKRLVTSRKPDDIPFFNAKLIEEFREGIPQRQFAS